MLCVGGVTSEDQVFVDYGFGGAGCVSVSLDLCHRFCVTV